MVKGVDHHPHQVRLLAVRVGQAHDPSREAHRLPVEETTMDVAPHKEVLIPFDVPFSELGPGWFCVMADVEVDGGQTITGPEGGGKRFGVPWPPEEVRKVDLKPRLKVGSAVIERIHSTPDRTEIRWRPPRGADDAELRLAAGKQRLPVVSVTDDPKTGIRITVTHPLSKRTADVTLEVSRITRGRQSATIDLT